MLVSDLPAEQFDDLKAFLAKDPIQNVYALGVLEDHKLGTSESPLWCCGLTEGASLVGAVLVGGAGGLVLPCVPDAAAAAEAGKYLAGRVKLRSVLGERAVVDALVKGAGCPAPQRSRAHRLFSAAADDLGPFVTADLRLAGPQDVPELMKLNQAASRELNGAELGAGGEEALLKRVEARVATFRTWVLAQGTRLLVKVDVGARSRYGVEFEGLYTIPSERRRGHATNVLGQLSRSLLSSIPRVVMRVDETDAGLGAVCRKVGLSPVRSQRLVIFG